MLPWRRRAGAEPFWRFEQFRIAGRSQGRARTSPSGEKCREQPEDITGGGKKLAAYENAKLASNFNPQDRDENTDYYIAKLDDLMKKFATLVPAPAQKQLL